VLVVEDDPRSANLVALYLARGGYRTEIACTGREALQKAEELHPLAITLDVMLPELDGWEVLRELKQMDATRDIPVMVVSVVDNERLGYALGADDYLVKPIDRHALLARLERYTSNAANADGKPRVLVIDDTPSAVELLEGALGQAGFAALTAPGGVEGIALAKQERPDAILLDLMMPGVSGFDVITALKADPDTRDIPVLVVTAKELSDEDRAALNGHVATILRKGPVEGMDLLGWLDDVMEHVPTRLEPAGVA
jgi:DNA-binding response OmpR family regulator